MRLKILNVNIQGINIYELLKKLLQKNVVEIVHGKEVANNVVSATEVLFGGKDLETLKPEEIKILKNRNSYNFKK